MIGHIIIIMININLSLSSTYIVFRNLYIQIDDKINIYFRDKHSLLCISSIPFLSNY